MAYYVAVRHNRTPEDYEYEWLVCIKYDPYQRGAKHDQPWTTTPDRSEAFRFETHAAAEMAAVWCSGQVREFK